ncbi:MAG: hypothetical protein HZB99_03795 [Candidatus Harrisonbacteria bacterium]|nr:hypothetical protein [Candidatus Harrisonbacteria bacterium]
MAENQDVPETNTDKIIRKYEFRGKEIIFFRALVLAYSFRIDEETREGLLTKTLEVIPLRILEAALKDLDELNEGTMRCH